MRWKVGEEEREVPLITKVLMRYADFGTIPKGVSEQCSREIDIKTVFIEFCEVKNGCLIFRDLSTR
jgi:hypothetical protein